MRPVHVLAVHERLRLSDTTHLEKETTLHVSLDRLNQVQYDSGLLYSALRLQRQGRPDAEPGRPSTSAVEDLLTPAIATGQPGLNGPGSTPPNRMIWVPVLNIDRDYRAPVEIRSAGGQLLPQAPDNEVLNALVAALVFSSREHLRRQVAFRSGDLAYQDRDPLREFLKNRQVARWALDQAIALFILGREPAGDEVGTPSRWLSESDVEALDEAIETLSSSGVSDLFERVRSTRLVVVGLDSSISDHILTFDGPHIRSRPQRYPQRAISPSNHDAFSVRKALRSAVDQIQRHWPPVHVAYNAEYSTVGYASETTISIETDSELRIDDVVMTIREPLPGMGNALQTLKDIRRIIAKLPGVISAGDPESPGPDREGDSLVDAARLLPSTTDPVHTNSILGSYCSEGRNSVAVLEREVQRRLEERLALAKSRDLGGAFAREPLALNSARDALFTLGTSFDTLRDMLKMNISTELKSLRSVVHAIDSVTRQMSTIDIDTRVAYGGDARDHIASISYHHTERAAVGTSSGSQLTVRMVIVDDNPSTQRHVKYNLTGLVVLVWIVGSIQFLNPLWPAVRVKQNLVSVTYSFDGFIGIILLVPSLLASRLDFAKKRSVVGHVRSFDRLVSYGSVAVSALVGVCAVASSANTSSIIYFGIGMRVGFWALLATAASYQLMNSISRRYDRVLSASFLPKWAEADVIALEVRRSRLVQMWLHCTARLRDARPRIVGATIRKFEHFILRLNAGPSWRGVDAEYAFGLESGRGEDFQ